MPHGIIIKSGSTDTTQEDLDKFLESKGYEVDKPEPPKEEPKLESFETEEEYNAAYEAWQAVQKKEEAANEDEEEKELLEAKEPKKLTKFQKRMKKILAPYKERIDELEKKLPKEAVTEVKKEENPRPKRTDFRTDDEYEDALLSWGTKKALAEQEVTDAKRQEQELLQGFLENYNERKEEFASEHEDFEDVIASSKVVIHPAVQMAIYEQENGPATVYYLATHPDYAAKLAGLTPLSAVMEVGRLSERLKSGKPGSGAGSEAQPKPKPVIPRPIRPVNTSATASTLTSRIAAEKGDFASFKAARRAGR